MTGEFINNFLYDKKEYGIVIDFFESMLRNDFIKILNYMGNNIDYSDYPIGYNFSDNCDEEDIENGVMFFLFDKNIVVNYTFFYECLKIACGIYLKSHKNDTEKVEKILNIIKERETFEKTIYLRT